MRVGVVLLAAFLLSGCQSMMDRAGLSIAGPGVEIDDKTLTDFIDRQDRAVKLLGTLAYGKDSAVIAKLSNNTATAAEWSQVVRAGIHFADVRCEHYMEALFKYNRTIRTTSNQLTILGSAAAATLAATQAAAREVALTAIAFGLAVTSLDNVGGSVLYQIDPSAVRNLVEALQQKFLEEEERKQGGSTTPIYDNRVDALRAVQAYVALCLPTVIESNVANAIKAGTVASVRGGNPWEEWVRIIEERDKDLGKRVRDLLIKAEQENQQQGGTQTPAQPTTPESTPGTPAAPETTTGSSTPAARPTPTPRINSVPNVFVPPTR